MTIALSEREKEWYRLEVITQRFHDSQWLDFHLDSTEFRQTWVLDVGISLILR